jgi:hypothetical protein
MYRIWYNFIIWYRTDKTLSRIWRTSKISPIQFAFVLNGPAQLCQLTHTERVTRILAYSPALSDSLIFHSLNVLCQKSAKFYLRAPLNLKNFRGCTSGPPLWRKDWRKEGWREWERQGYVSESRKSLGRKGEWNEWRGIRWGIEAGKGKFRPHWQN